MKRSEREQGKTLAQVIEMRIARKVRSHIHSSKRCLNQLHAAGDALSKSQVRDLIVLLSQAQGRWNLVIEKLHEIEKDRDADELVKRVWQHDGIT